MCSYNNISKFTYNTQSVPDGKETRNGPFTSHVLSYTWKPNAHPHSDIFYIKPQTDIQAHQPHTPSPAYPFQPKTPFTTTSHNNSPTLLDPLCCEKKKFLSTIREDTSDTENERNKYYRHRHFERKALLLFYVLPKDDPNAQQATFHVCWNRCKKSFPKNI